MAEEYIKASGKAIDAHKNFLQQVQDISGETKATYKKMTPQQFREARNKLSPDDILGVLSLSFAECCKGKEADRINNYVLFTAMLESLKEKKGIDQAALKLANTMNRILKQNGGAFKGLPAEVKGMISDVNEIVPDDRKVKFDLAQPTESKSKATKHAPQPNQPTAKTKKKEKENSEWIVIDKEEFESPKEQQPSVKVPSKTPGVLSKIGRFFTGKGR